MVKCSFFLSFAVCAIVGTSSLAEAVDSGSALNDTSASGAGDAGVTTDVITDTSASTAAVITTSASGSTDVAGVTTDTSASSTADVTTTSTSDASDADGVTTDTSASSTADVTTTSTSDASDADGVTTDTSASSTADVTTTSASGASNVADVTTVSSASAAVDASAPVVGNAAPTDAPTPTVASSTSGTVTATVKPTTKPVATVRTGPTPIGGQVTVVPGYANCGGVGFDYTVYMPEETSTSEFTRLTCEAGYRCQDVESSDFFQCKEWPSRDPVAFYGQCGGGNYDGQTFCAPGAVCKYISASFSQCLPTY